MMVTHFLSFLAFFFAVISSPLYARENNVTFDLYASQNAAKTGESFQIALRQNIRDGWHTYWIIQEILVNLLSLNGIRQRGFLWEIYIFRFQKK